MEEFVTKLSVETYFFIKYSLYFVFTFMTAEPETELVFLLLLLFIDGIDFFEAIKL